MSIEPSYQRRGCQERAPANGAKSRDLLRHSSEGNVCQGRAASFLLAVTHQGPNRRDDKMESCPSAFAKPAGEPLAPFSAEPAHTSGSGRHTSAQPGPIPENFGFTANPLEPEGHLNNFPFPRASCSSKRRIAHSDPTAFPACDGPVS